MYVRTPRLNSTHYIHACMHAYAAIILYYNSRIYCVAYFFHTVVAPEHWQLHLVQHIHLPLLHLHVEHLVYRYCHVIQYQKF